MIEWAPVIVLRSQKQVSPTIFYSWGYLSPTWLFVSFRSICPSWRCVLASKTGLTETEGRAKADCRQWIAPTTLRGVALFKNESARPSNDTYLHIKTWYFGVRRTGPFIHHSYENLWTVMLAYAGSRPDIASLHGSRVRMGYWPVVIFSTATPSSRCCVAQAWSSWKIHSSSLGLYFTEFRQKAQLKTKHIGLSCNKVENIAEATTNFATTLLILR